MSRSKTRIEEVFYLFAHYLSIPAKRSTTAFEKGRNWFWERKDNVYISYSRHLHLTYSHIESRIITNIFHLETIFCGFNNDERPLL